MFATMQHNRQKRCNVKVLFQYLEWQSIVLLKIGEKSFLQAGPNVLERRNVGIHTKATCNTFHIWLE